ADFQGIHARPDVTVEDVLAVPPIEQRRETLSRGIDGPVKLRRQVIAPTVAQPLARIGVKSRVGIEAADGRRILGPPDAEWADPELHPRFIRLDCGINLLNEY